MARKRFVVLHQEGMFSGQKILLDTETGVNYLFVRDGYAGGLTPLLDRDGKPMLSFDANTKQSTPTKF